MMMADWLAFVLAFPSVLPWQITLISALAIHAVLVLMLTVKRGHPAWLGLCFGLLPAVGIFLALMIPLADRRADIASAWMPVRRLRGGKETTGVLVVRALLIAGILGTSVAIFEVPNLRFDMTAKRLYSLDPLARDVLAQLDRQNETLLIEYFYSPSSLRPPRFATLPKEIEEMLQEYRAHSGKVAFRMIEVPQQQSEGSTAVGRDSSVLTPMELSSRSMKTDEQIRQEEERMTEAERQRARILRRVEQIGFNPIVERIVEGNRDQTVNYFSGFFLSYGAAGTERIDGVTVTRNEAAAGKRPVDHANFLLATTIQRLVERATERPLTVRAVSLDGKKARFVGVSGDFREGATVASPGGKKFRIHTINAATESVSVQALDDQTAAPTGEPVALRVADRTRFTVGFVEGLGEWQASRNEFTRLLNATHRFEVETVSLDNGAVPVPEHIDVLVLTSTPQELTQRAQYEIDQYLMRGGRLLMFHGLMTPPPPAQPNPFASWDTMHPSWAAFARRYGVKVGDNFVFDERCLELRTSTHYLTRVTSVLRLTPANLKDHPIAAGLVLSDEAMGENTTFLPYVTSIEPTAGQPDTVFDAFLHSTPQAWQTPAVSEILRGPFTWDQDTLTGPALNRVLSLRPRQRGQYPLAASVVGQFSSAFKDRPEPPIPAPGSPDMPPMRIPDFPHFPDDQGHPDGDEPPADAADAEPESAAEPGAQPPGFPPGLPLDAEPLTPPTPQPTRLPRLDASEWRGKVVVFGTNMIYPIYIRGANTDEMFVNAVEFLAAGDQLLGLKSKITARNPIDPTVGEDARSWLGWLVSLLVPLALVVVSLLVVIFGWQERNFFRAREEAVRAATRLAGHTSATRIMGASVAESPRERVVGVVALIVGALLVGTVVAAWVTIPALAWGWLLMALLAAALLGLGASRVIER